MTENTTTKPGSLYQAAAALALELEEVVPTTGCWVDEPEKKTQVLEYVCSQLLDEAREYRSELEQILRYTHDLEDTAKRIRNKIERGYALHDSDGLGQYGRDLDRLVATSNRKAQNVQRSCYTFAQMLGGDSEDHVITQAFDRFKGVAFQPPLG